MPATIVWPRDAAHTVEITSPSPVPAKMIGSAAALALAGTYPTSASPSAMDPAAKIGRPRIDGSPPKNAVDGGGAATAVVSARPGVCTLSLVAIVPSSSLHG